MPANAHVLKPDQHIPPVPTHMNKDDLDSNKKFHNSSQADEYQDDHHYKGTQIKTKTFQETQPPKFQTQPFGEITLPIDTTRIRNHSTSKSQIRFENLFNPFCGFAGGLNPCTCNVHMFFTDVFLRVKEFGNSSF